MRDRTTVIMTAIGCILCCWVSFAAGVAVAVKELRQAAVQHDAGHWIIDSSTGEREWKWGPR